MRHGVLSRAVGWFCLILILAVATAFGAEQLAPGVGRGAAHLAVRVDDRDAWRLVESGETLPERCQLRSAGPGIRAVRLAGARLLVEGGATLRLDATARRVELLAGRTLVSSEPADEAPAAPWRVTADAVTADVPPGSRSVWSRSPAGMVEIATLAGRLELRAEGAGARIANSAPSAALFETTKNRFATRPLAPPAQEQLNAVFSEPVAAQGLGQLVVEDAQAGSAQRLDVARYHVNVVLQPPVALVQIDQSFYNPYPQQREGTFVFNLPAGAAVSRFAMYVTPDQLIEGELVGRRRANEVYTSIVNSRRDPAILEEIGDNLFRMRVFPIFARDTKRILLDYTVPLEPLGDRYKFRLPLFSDLKPIWDFSVTGQLNGDARFDTLDCPTHSAVEIRREKTQASWKWTERDYQPQSDLLLSFRGTDERRMTVRSQRPEPLPAPAMAPGTALTRDPRSAVDTTYFLLTAPSALAFDAQAAPPPADVLLLVDTSEYARNRASYQEHARTVLRHLRPEDRLRTAVVDVNHRWLHDDWVRGGSATAEQILDQLARQYPLGRSAPSRTIAGAVREAFGGAVAPPPTEPPTARRRIVLWLGEGLETREPAPPRAAPRPPGGGGFFQFGVSVAPAGNVRESAGPLDTDELAARLREFDVRLTALVASVELQSVKDAYARLESLAQGSGGQLFDVSASPGQLQFYDWLLAGCPAPARIESLEVTGAIAEDLLYPKVWIPGRPFRIYGRAARREQLALRMTVRRDGPPFEHRQTFEMQADDALFVGRTWAQRRLASWRNDEPVDAGARELQRLRIIGLSQEWSVLSPHTAFLVLETERDYQRWNIDRTVRRKYWKPQGAEPTRQLPAEWLARIMNDQKAAGDEARLALRLAAARQSLERREFAKAYWELTDAGAKAKGDQLQELAQLRRQAEAGLAREALVRQTPREFPIFVPHARSSSASPWSRFALPADDESTEAPGSRFAKQLARTVRIAEVPEQSLADLANWVETMTGVQVDLDRRELEAQTIGTDSPVAVLGRGEISIGSYLRFALEPHTLCILEEPDRLLVTSRHACEKRLKTEVYPVADLLLSDGVPTFGQLRLGPAEARRDAAAARLRAKLRSPVSFEFLAETTLQTAVEHLGETIGAPIVLDVRALESESIGTDTPLGATRLRGVPAGAALRRILSDQNLTYVVRNEAILVTTREEAENHADTRIYSGRELVHMAPVGPQVVWNYSTQPPTAQRGWWPNGIWPRGGDGNQNVVLGMGGGMGGMGGMMGGTFSSTAGRGGFFGGPVGGPTAVEDSRATPLSRGGEGQVAAPAERGGGAPTDTPAGIASAPEKPVALKPPVVAPDPMPIMDVVQKTTGKPDPGWIDDGGVGEIAYFDPTFDLVIRTTEEVHEQVAALFERLTKVPKSGLSPSQASLVAPRIGRDELNLISWSTLTNFFMSMVAKPEPGWVDDGGVNTIEPDATRLALVVNATQSSHEEFHALLTRLRRSRYEAKFQTRPWEIDSWQPLGEVAPVDPARAIRPAPQVTAEELARLSVRRVPLEGRWRGKRREGNGRPRALAITLGAGRFEFNAPNWIVRGDPRQGAEAHTDLGLVVLHRDVDSMRRRLDDELPWWPHRTNEELAALYRVEELPDASNEREAVLRLTPRLQGDSPMAGPGAAEKARDAEPPVAFLKAAFARDNGRLLRYEIHFDGKLVGKLVLSASPRNMDVPVRVQPGKPADKPASVPSPRSMDFPVRAQPDKPAPDATEPFAVLEDASGRRLVEWKTVAGEPVAADPPPAVDAGWEQYAVLDRRAARPELDPQYHAIVTAMARGEWRAAYERLQVAIAARPDLPLLRLLRGACALNDRSVAPRAQALADLQAAAASAADGLAGVLATQPQFDQQLDPRELLEILVRQPEDRRLVEVSLRLARLEQQRGDKAAALGHARRAWQQTVDGGAAGEIDSMEAQANRRFLITLLVENEQIAEARRAADESLAGGRAAVPQILLLAEVFGQQGPAASALDLVQSQLKARTWSAAERYRLMRRAADYAEGFARAQWLFEALQVPDAPAAEREADIELLLASVTTAEEADRLLEQLKSKPGVPQAADSSDQTLRGRLLYQRALLTTDIDESGRALLVALAHGPIPASKEELVTTRLLAARQYAPCVEWFEQQLRSGRRLDPPMKPRFARALRQLGRDREAARAE